jgi:hypothetical protein
VGILGVRVIEANAEATLVLKAEQRLELRVLGAAELWFSWKGFQRFDGMAKPYTVYQPICGALRKRRILPSDILGLVTACWVCEGILFHNGWNPVSDMSTPRPTPTA